jgi:hypothetical protein
LDCGVFRRFFRFTTGLQLSKIRNSVFRFLSDFGLLFRSP